MSPEVTPEARTILAVDDDAHVLELVDSVLSRFGYRVLLAATTEEAIAKVQQSGVGIDLLLMDAVMPKMSGPELADILLFLQPNMKVLFITGLDALSIRLAFDHPCDSLQKPFAARRLVLKVEEMLGSVAEASQDQITRV